MSSEVNVERAAGSGPREHRGTDVSPDKDLFFEIIFYKQAASSVASSTEGTPPSPLGSYTPLPPLRSPPSPWLVSTAVVSEGQMTGELAPGRALSHPGAIRLVANNRCFRPGEDQSGGIMGNVRSSAFYTSAQMDEITLVSF